MTLEVESPTAEAIYSAIRQMNVPAREWMRLCQLMGAENAITEHPSYQDFWTEEDIADLRRSAGADIEAHYGPEQGDYEEYRQAG